MALFSGSEWKTTLVPADKALPGRFQAVLTASTHFVTGETLKAEVPAGMEEIQLGMGCFWGVERIFWQLPGVFVTAAGYAGGITPNPTYEEVCSGRTGHTEAVRVVYDPAVISTEALLKLFWENHDPTQGMRQGGDTGTQYRSAIYYTNEAQKEAAERTRAAYEAALSDAGRGPITTEIREAGPFYYAEDYHQQYLAKNPNGYCGIGGTGVTCPIGTGVSA
ncbi:peptide methionine sulfoxide reductase MsrA [Marinicauda pacifica]|uniref:Peptide methionine sulfoxide reductase MsrA n=1 Tax=Marinicauda pacifica TaxID=1133559 RepID=A0A4S2H8S3_9PROT|nr:peptide-methionine (S)-S-oxide reductase MsrA [Marinicauda pacifica]TGY92240.1 peptide-methionine (S)-S-oxide reductase MsrA [Marinicauda pacifica]GGE47214.1 peptide methionine sulfoxide reductase MsrA [Marinicauda pacifica]